MSKVVVAKFADLNDRGPAAALVANVDLVIVRFDNAVSVFYGRCLHRGAMMVDGFVDGSDNLICGVHNWDYRLDTGVSSYNNEEALPKFESWVENGDVLVEEAEISAWHDKNPQPFDRDAYLGQYADASHDFDLEPANALIQQYARDGLSKVGHHGVMTSMGVPPVELPKWDDIQLLAAQLAVPPMLDDEEVGTDEGLSKNSRDGSIPFGIYVANMTSLCLSFRRKQRSGPFG